MDKRRRNRTIYTVLIIICIIGFWLFENFYTPEVFKPAKGETAGVEVPEFILPVESYGEIVRHKNYMLSYSEQHEQALWVAYTLKRDHLTYENRERPYFVEDPYVRTKSADWRNYRGSGYDRGHLCPAGDRRFSEFAYNETFYTSNISPQDRDFNAGIWNRLELQVRKWAKSYDTVYVITGGSFESDLGAIGEEDVTIPGAFYKIVARNEEKNLKVIAFLFPHRDSDKPLSHYVVPVDQVEDVTGIDFFEALPDPFEDSLESRTSVREWEFSGVN